MIRHTAAPYSNRWSALLCSTETGSRVGATSIEELNPK